MNECDSCGFCGGEDVCLRCGMIYETCPKLCESDDYDYDKSINACCLRKDFDCMGVCNGTARVMPSAGGYICEKVILKIFIERCH